MIRLQSIQIRNVRGIRDLALEFDGSTFAIQGPNGSGKSAVVDAIEFVLTGSITRLSGSGTSTLNAKRHGPHVDYRDKPREATVTLSAQVVATGADVQIERSLDKPKEFTVTPDDDATRNVFESVAKHPEFVLSRRQVIKYIVVEAGKRAEEIQSLLKLERIGEMRSALRTASTACNRSVTSAKAVYDSARNALKTALGIEDDSKEAVLKAVNDLRSTAGLDHLDDLTHALRADKGLHDSKDSKEATVSKKVALEDLKSLHALFDGETLTTAADQIKQLGLKVVKAKEDPSLLNDLEKQQLIDLGGQHFDGATCPLCDAPWKEDAFRELLRKKSERLSRGRELKSSLDSIGEALEIRAQEVAQRLRSVGTTATSLNLKEESQRIHAAGGSLEELRPQLQTAVAMVQVTDKALETLIKQDPAVQSAVAAVQDAVAALPDESGKSEASAALIQVQPRIEDVRKARSALNVTEKGAARAATALSTYDATVDSFLNTLYKEVENDFCEFYRLLNEDDEASFTAQLQHETGSVDLSVDFYGRGLFPPVAYHSEGHQDGMGVCLYLALMKKVLCANFSFAVLDDVVMSVDSSHRKEFCRLLREKFPNTQFIITTHDKAWLNQMRSAGLVTRRTSLLFTRWNIDDGPCTAEAKDSWEKITQKLDANEVPEAAFTLRRYLESVALELAELTGTSVPLRQDGDYELGEVLPKVVSRWKDLFKRAVAAAKSWGQTNKEEASQGLVDELKNRYAATQAEQWAVNKSVHYNAWADFSANDFRPVVRSFKSLLELFRCDKCETWFSPEPSRYDPNTLRCSCGETNLNLKKK